MPTGSSTRWPPITSSAARRSWSTSAPRRTSTSSPPRASSSAGRWPRASRSPWTPWPRAPPQLRKVELVRPRSVIGKNTVEALQSGALYGFAGQVDGLVDRIVAELGGRVTAVIATGGLAPIVVAESRTITHHEPDLTLIGLDLIHAKNVRVVRP